MIKIKPNEIAFDIDGVVADTMASFIKVAKERYGIEGIRREDIKSYWLEDCLPIDEKIIGEIIGEILKDPFNTDLKPMDGAVEVLTKLAKKSSLVFVTARPIKEPIVEWLRTTLKQVDKSYINVIATGRHEAKIDVLKKLNISYFLEDHLDTCIQLFDAGIGAIVYDHPWNQGKTPFLRIKKWAELKGLLDI